MMMASPFTGLISGASAMESELGGTGGGRSVHVDIGGEGRYPDAINLNPIKVQTTTGTPGNPIPNLVQGTGENAPFLSNSVDKITVESAPIRPGTASEIQRMIKPGGEIRLMHPADYAVGAHQHVIDKVGGSVTQQTVDSVTTTTIKAPN